MYDPLIASIQQFSDPTEFERLCCDVLSVLGYQGIDPQGVGHRNGGKDALFDQPAVGKVIFHFSLRKDWEVKLQEDIHRVKLAELEPNLFVFCTTQRVTPSKKDKWKDTCQRELACGLEIFDQERLRVAIETLPELKKRYFPHAHAGTDERIQDLEKAMERLTVVVSEALIPAGTQLISMASKVMRTELHRITQLASSGQLEQALLKIESLLSDAGRLYQEVGFAYFTAGNLYYIQGNLQKSKEMYRAVLTCLPTHFSSLYNLAVLAEHDVKGRRYGYGFDASEACYFYEEARKKAWSKSWEADCINNEGVLELKLDRVDAARELFEKAQKCDPSHLNSLLNLATTMHDEPDQARDIYYRLLNTPLRTEAFMNLATTYVSEKRWGDALVQLRNALRTRKRRGEIFVLLGNLAFERSRFSQARAYLLKAIVEDIEDPWAHFWLGRSYSALGERAKAIVAFRTAVSMAPDLDLARYFLADILDDSADKSELNEALEHYRAVLSAQPDSALIHNQVGCVYMSMRMFASARVEFEKAIELDPEGWQPYFNLGVVCEYGYTGDRYGHGANFAAAIRHYVTASMCDPQNFMPSFNRGVLLAYTGRAKEASDAFQQALMLSPQNDSILTNLAVAQKLLGEKEAAQENLRKAIALNPANLYARKNLQLF